MQSILTLDKERKWAQAIKKRVSTRKYCDKVTTEQMKRLEELASELSLDGSVRISISSDAKDLFKGMFAGKFENISCAAAFLTKDDTPMEILGYRGEAFVLECTSLGLGTCWVAATYNKKEADRIFKLQEGEKRSILTPLGKPLDGIMRDSTIRDRKSLEKMTRLNEDEIRALQNWQKEGLISAQAAPSAMNMQPLSYTVTDEYIEIQPSGMAFTSRALDMGIAMLHLELGITSAGKNGEWEKAGKGYKFVIK